jgi:hypothetical protein
MHIFSVRIAIAGTSGALGYIMQYCLDHERAFIPSGYNFRGHEPIHAYWHPFPQNRLGFALMWIESMHLADPIVIVASACDLCEEGGGFHPKLPGADEKGACGWR